MTPDVYVHTVTHKRARKKRSGFSVLRKYGVADPDPGIRDRKKSGSRNYLKFVGVK
jgi:hypothetical protein